MYSWYIGLTDQARYHRVWRTADDCPILGRDSRLVSTVFVGDVFTGRLVCVGMKTACTNAYLFHQLSGSCVGNPATTAVSIFVVLLCDACLIEA